MTTTHPDTHDTAKFPAGSNETRQLVDFLSSLAFADLPREVVVSAQAAVLDHLACGFYAMDKPWVTSLRRALFGTETPGSTGSSPLYGLGIRVSPGEAAMVNGTSAHGFELDDIYWRMHPGSIVISSALATGATTNIDGRDLLAAIACGYELMGRVGNSIGTGHSDDGFHTTGIAGPFGSAMATSRVYGLSADTAHSAVGIAASFGSGIKAYIHGPGMLKRLHAGQAARNGILAADLARADFEGPDYSLEGRYGFCSIFSDGSFVASSLTNGLGVEYAIADTYMKPYSCCGAMHGAISGIEELRSQVSFDVEDIASITVGTTKHALQKSQPNPVDMMTAQYSFECATALALIGKVRDPMSFSPEFVMTGTAGELVRKVTVIVDDEANSNFPKSADARVTLHFKDGHDLSIYGVGHGGHNLTPDERMASARQKFATLTTDRIAPERQDAIVAAVSELADGISTEMLLRLL